MNNEAFNDRQKKILLNDLLEEVKEDISNVLNTKDIKKLQENTDGLSLDFVIDHKTLEEVYFNFDKDNIWTKKIEKENQKIKPLKNYNVTKINNIQNRLKLMVLAMWSKWYLITNHKEITKMAYYINNDKDLLDKYWLEKVVAKNWLSFGMNPEANVMWIRENAEHIAVIMHYYNWFDDLRNIMWIKKKVIEKYMV